MLTVLFTYMALYSLRYMPLFAIIVAIILVKQSEYMVKQSDTRFMSFMKKRAERISLVDSSAKGYLWPVAGIFLVLVSITSGNVVHKYDDKTMPVAAVAFMR